MSDFGAPQQQAPGLAQDPAAKQPGAKLTLPWQEADLAENLHFQEAFDMRMREVEMRNQDASPEDLQELIGDQWGMMAIQKTRAESLGLDPNKFWQGTNVLNENLVEQRWLATMYERFQIHDMLTQRPDVAETLNGLHKDYQDLLKQHEFGKKYHLEALQATDNPYVRKRLMDSIFPLVSHEWLRERQGKIYAINELMESIQPGLNLYVHPDTAAMAKGLTTTINHQLGGFLRKEKEKPQPRLGSEAFEAVMQPIESFGDAVIGGSVYMGLKALRWSTQLGMNVKSWALGEPHWEVPDFENAFSYTLDEKGNPVYVGGHFGVPELAGTLLGAFGFERQGIIMAAKGRSQREISDSWEDETIQGIVNSGFAAIGGVWGWNKAFLAPSLKTGVAARETLEGLIGKERVLGQILQGRELIPRAAAWLASGSKSAQRIKKALEITAGGAHLALRQGMASGSMEKFGQSAMAGFIMAPVNYIVGSYGDKLDVALTMGGKLMGPLWTFGVRAVRGLFEGIGFGLAGATTGLPLEPMFEDGTEEHTLLQNFLKDPNAENTKAFLGYMGQWVFGNMIGQAFMGGPGQRQAIDVHKIRVQARERAHTRAVTNKEFIESAAAEDIYKQEFEREFGAEAEAMGEAGREKMKRERIELKMTRGELMAEDEIETYLQLVDEDKREKVRSALGALADIFKQEAAVITAAEKKGYRYQPLVDVLEAGGGRLDVSEDGVVSITLNKNLMSRLMRNRIRAQTRLGVRIGAEAGRFGETKGIDEIGLMVAFNPQTGGWDVAPSKGGQDEVSMEATNKMLDSIAKRQGVSRKDLDLTQIADIHSHSTRTPFSISDTDFYLAVNWSKDAPPGKDYAPVVVITSEGGYVMRPKGGKKPQAIYNRPSSDLKNIRRDLIKKGFAGELGAVMQKYLMTRFGGSEVMAYDAVEQALRNYDDDKPPGVGERPLLDLGTQAWHLHLKAWADKNGLEYGFFDPKTMAKRWDEYTETQKFNFEGATDPLDTLTMVGSLVEQRIARERVYGPEQEPVTPKMQPPPKPAERPPIKPAQEPAAEESLQEAEIRIYDWKESLPVEQRGAVERVLNKVQGETPEDRRSRLLAFIDSVNRPQPTPEAPAPPAEPALAMKEISARLNKWLKGLSPAEQRDAADKMRAVPGETPEQRQERLMGLLRSVEPPEGKAAPGEPDYVKLWETLKPREGESIEDRHARIQAEIDKATPPPPKGLRPPPPGFFREPPELPRKGAPSDQELSQAGRDDEKVGKAAPSAQPAPGAPPPTLEQQRAALKKGFEQQKTYWAAAQAVNKYGKKIVEHANNFFKNYFTNKDYRKELARKVRHSVGHGAKYLVLGPDEAHIKARADVMRQSVTIAAKNSRVLRSRAFKQILDDEDLTPAQRQTLIDDTLQYGVLRDLVANEMRPLKETVEVEDRDPETGEKTGKKVPYTVLRRKPRELPFGVTIEAVKAELADLEARLTPAQRSAYVNLRAHLDAAWDEMVMRRLVREEDKLADYFPHKILDWAEADHPAIGTTIPKQRPVRPYLMGREGSRRMFDTSVKAIQDYLMRVDVQNAKHDFLDITARNIHLRALREHGLEHTQWDNVETEEWLATREYMEKNGYVLLDTRYGRTGKESLERSEVVQKILSDIVEEAGIPMMPEVIVGRNFRPDEDKGIYFVTKEYAEFIRAQFASTAWQMAGLKAANRLVGKWIKGPMLRGLLGTSVIERSTRNLISDLHGIYFKGDGLAAVIDTLKNIPVAKKIIHAWRTQDIDPSVVNTLSHYEHSILKELESRGTLQANVRGQEFVRDDPIETEWLEKTVPEVQSSLGRMLSKMYRSDFKWAKALDDYSENLLRVSYFMRERLERIKVLKAAGVPESEGRDEFAADYAHLKTGDVLVNYNHLTPLERHALNGLIFPFYTWAKSNFFETMAVVIERPLTSAMRAALTSAPFIVWNSLFAKDEEERLWNANPRLAAKPHLILPWIRDSFGSPLVLAWDSTLGEALGFLGLDRLADDSFQFFTGHGEPDILAKDILPGAFENMKNKWKNFTAPWVRAITTQVFESEFMTTGERAEQFFKVDLPQISRPWAELQSLLQKNRQERSPESVWVQFAPFLGFPDIHEGVTGEALPQHFLAGQLQRQEAQLSKAIGNNMRRFTSGMKAQDPAMMGEAVDRVWTELGDELSESGMEPVHLISRFIDRAINELTREELIEMGLTPKWLQLSKSQQAVLLLQLMERNK